MNRGYVGFVLGLGGFLLGGAAFFFALVVKKDVNEHLDAMDAMVSQDKDAFGAWGEKMKSFDAAQKEMQRRVNAIDAPRAGGDRVAALEARLDQLEKSLHGALPPQAAPKNANAAAGADAEFEELRKKVLAGEATNDDLAKFFAELREKPEILAGLIKDAEQSVKDRPRDKEAHRALAGVYLQKLMSVPDGMEKGVWSNKMIGEEKAIVDIDPEDWDAHRSIATNYSFWPEQFNKRPDAIKEFEACRKIQEARTPEPKFASTYLQLRQLYLKDGRTEDAKKVLDDGLVRFPDDEELKKAKEGAK